MQKKSQKKSAPPDPYSKAFGRRVRQARVEVGMTQAQLAAEIGDFRLDTMSNVERGQVIGIPLEMLRGLAAFCLDQQINLHWLITGDGSIRLGAAPLARASRKDLMRAMAQQIVAELADLTDEAGVPPADRTGEATAPPPEPSARRRAGVAAVGGRIVRTVEAGYRVADVEQLPADWRGRYVPIIGRIAAGAGIDTVEAEESPPGWADQYLIYDGAPPSAVAVRVAGNSMEPQYRDGDIVVADPAQPVKGGVCCVIVEADGERTARLKRLRIVKRTAWLESLNPDYQPIKLSARRIGPFKLIGHLPLLVERAPGE